jgi:hypothetical protein
VAWRPRPTRASAENFVARGRWATWRPPTVAVSGVTRIRPPPAGRSRRRRPAAAPPKKGWPGQGYFLNHFRADERLMSGVLPSPGCAPGLPSPPAFPPPKWMFSGLCAESLRVRRPVGFVVTWRSTTVKGCGRRSRAVRLSVPERCRGHRKLARARPSRWAGRGRATPAAVRAVRPSG